MLLLAVEVKEANLLASVETSYTSTPTEFMDPRMLMSVDDARCVDLG